MALNGLILFFDSQIPADYKSIDATARIFHYGKKKEEKAQKEKRQGF